MDESLNLFVKNNYVKISSSVNLANERFIQMAAS